MLFLVVMSILVALSDLFSPDAKVVHLDLNVEKKVPVYVAVLSSFIFPLTCSIMTMVIKYMKKHHNIESNDWVFGNSLIYGVIAAVVGIVYFLIEKGSFRWDYLIQGFVGGFLTMLGAALITKALMVDGAPNGPCIAVYNSQIMMLVIVDALLNQAMPFSM